MGKRDKQASHLPTMFNEASFRAELSAKLEELADLKAQTRYLREGICSTRLDTIKMMKENISARLTWASGEKECAFKKLLEELEEYEEILKSGNLENLKVQKLCGMAFMAVTKS